MIFFLIMIIMPKKHFLGKAPVITLRFSFPFHKAKVLDDIKNRNLIQNIFQQVLGVDKVALEAVLAETPPPNMVNKIIGSFGGAEVNGG